MLEQQNTIYEAAQSGKAEMRRVVVIGEAHKFLPAQRIKQMPKLAARVNRIARAFGHARTTVPAELAVAWRTIHWLR